MIPIAELRTLVGLGSADATKDATLTALELAAVAAVERKTRLYLGELAEATDRVIGDGTAILNLPRWPVTAVALIEESYPFDVVPAILPITTYRIRDEYQLWRTGAGVWSDGYEYAVTYTAGFAPGAFDPIFYDAVKQIISARYPVADAAGASSAALVKKKETFGPYSVEYDTSSGGAADSDSAESTVDAILTRVARYGRIRV